MSAINKLDQNTSRMPLIWKQERGIRIRKVRMKVPHLLRSFTLLSLLTFICRPGLAQTSGGPSGSGPQLTILTPTNGQVFSAPADVSIEVSMSDSSNFIHEVSFYDGTNLIA